MSDATLQLADLGQASTTLSYFNTGIETVRFVLEDTAALFGDG